MPRLTPKPGGSSGGPPTGDAGGVLAGTYPNPGFSNGMATDQELDAVAEAKADVGHGHAISDTTGLQTALDGKAASSHSHAQSDVTNLTTDLAAKAAASDLTAHLNDTSDAHDASAISFSATGSISSTDVQAAIAEVANEAAGGSAHTIRNEGSDMTARSGLNFVGAAVDVTDDAGNGETEVSIVAPRYIALGSDATAVVGTAYGNAASGLDIAVTSGVPVRFQYYVLWQPNAATTGARFSLNGPAITALSYSVRWNTTATVITQSPIGTAFDQAFTVGTASNNNSNNIAIVEGVFVPGGNGTLALRCSAEVVSPGSVTVKAGSSVLYW